MIAAHAFHLEVNLFTLLFHTYLPLPQSYISLPVARFQSKRSHVR